MAGPSRPIRHRFFFQSYNISLPNYSHLHKLARIFAKLIARVMFNNPVNEEFLAKNLLVDCSGTGVGMMLRNCTANASQFSQFFEVKKTGKKLLEPLVVQKILFIKIK